MRKGLAHHPDTIGYIHAALYALYRLAKGETDVELPEPSLRAQNDLLQWLNEDAKDAAKGQSNLTIRDLI